MLLAQDIFSRYAWAEPMETRDKATEAFERVLARAEGEDHRAPHVLNTDEDTVFMASRFQSMLERNRIIHVLKSSREDIATIDRLIGAIRRGLAVSARAGDGNWAEMLQRVVAGHN